jgi:hypothetical protein
MATLRQDAAVSSRSAGLRRRNLQLQSHLRPGNDGGRTRSGGGSTLFTQRRGRLGATHFRATAKVIGVAGQLAAGGDLSLPEVEGPRPVPVRVTNKYVDRVLAAAESDIVVAEQLAKVVTLIDPPTRLLRPAVIVRVATVNLRRRQRDQAATATQRFGDPQAVGNRQPRASAEAYPGELHCSTRKSANAGDVAVATGESSSPQNCHDENLSRSWPSGAARTSGPGRLRSGGWRRYAVVSAGPKPSGRSSSSQ